MSMVCRHSSDQWGGSEDRAINFPRIIVLALVVALLPAAGSAYWIQHANNALNPAVSPEQFQPAGDGSRPAPGNLPPPLSMEILPFPPGFSPEIADAVARGVDAWNNVPGSGIRVQTLLPDLAEVYDNNWASRYLAEDGRNTIEFVFESWPAFWGPNIMAITIPHLDDQGRIMEADIFCNAQDFKWRVFEVEGYFPVLDKLNYIDTQALITHEMGHVFGLGHSQYFWSAMYWLPGVADTRTRHLTFDEQQGLCSLYPLTASDVSPPSIWGINNNVPAGDCGMSYLDLSSATLAYVTHGYPLSGPHIMFMDPPLAGETVWPYCLLGSGFSPDYFQAMDLFLDGSPLNTVVAAAYVGPNFVKATLMNNAGGFPPLAIGVYDPAVIQSPGGTGLLSQGLFVNTLANTAPEAVIQPAKTQAQPSTWVALDGAGSFDSDGDTISYQWIVEGITGASRALLSSDTAPKTLLYIPAPGLYVVRLTVNDGTIDSVADQVLIRASYSLSASGDDDGDFSMFGCAAAAGPRSPGVALPSLLILAAPMLLGLALKKALTPAGPSMSKL